MRQEKLHHQSDRLSSDIETGRGLDPDSRAPDPVFGCSYGYNKLYFDILILTPCLLNGGTEVQLLSLCQAFQNIGKKVAVACLFEFSPPMLTAFRNSGLPVYCLSKTNNRPKGIIRTAFKVSVLLWKLSHRLIVRKVHVGYMAPGAMSAFFARCFLSKRVYVSVHACSSSKYSASLLRLLTHGIVRKVIFVSKSAADSFCKCKRVKISSHYTIVYNALPRDIGLCFKSDDLICKRICIGWVGRLEPIKGSDVLRWIINRKEILKMPVDWIIAGEGSELPAIRNLLSSYGLNDRVDICGNVSRHCIASVYDKIDILFVPSREEAFGLSALEGMARGCVLVASKAPGLNELLDGSKAAIQFDIQHPDKAVEAIIFLCRNRDRLRLMSKYATEYASRFTQSGYQSAIIAAHS
ncbi:MAG: glycosyltransferase family 4 protein [Bacteroides sp.]|nr:glycosyltransferase family 4 protein [Bacteroides sp.]